MYKSDRFLYFSVIHDELVWHSSKFTALFADIDKDVEEGYSIGFYISRCLGKRLIILPQHFFGPAILSLELFHVKGT
jgi:hypothetical protein